MHAPYAPASAPGPLLAASRRQWGHRCTRAFWPPCPEFCVVTLAYARHFFAAADSSTEPRSGLRLGPPGYSGVGCCSVFVDGAGAIGAGVTVGGN